MAACLLCSSAPATGGRPLCAECRKAIGRAAARSFGMDPDEMVTEVPAAIAELMGGPLDGEKVEINLPPNASAVPAQEIVFRAIRIEGSENWTNPFHSPYRVQMRFGVSEPLTDPHYRYAGRKKDAGCWFMYEYHVPDPGTPVA